MLKFSIPLQENIIGFKFSDTLSLRLFILFESGKHQTYDFKMEYQSSLSNNNFSNDNGTISVINGRSVKLTPLGVCNMPPPFALKTLDIPSKITPSFSCNWWKNYLFVIGTGGFIIIHNDLTCNDFSIIYEYENKIFDKRVKCFAFSADINNKLGYLILVKYVEDSMQDELIKLSFNIDYTDKKLTLKENCSIETLKVNLCSGIFNSCVSDELMDFDFLTKLEFTGASPTKEEKEETKKKKKGGEKDKKELEKDLFNNLMFNPKDEDDDDLQQDNDSNPNLGQKGNKFIYLIHSEDHSKEKSISSLLLPSNEKLNKNNINDSIIRNITFDINRAKSVFFNNEDHIVYLTKNNRLFLDHFILALDVTSFEIFNKFLFFTQLSNTPYHTLHIIDLSLPLPTHLSKTEALYTPNFTTKNFNIRTIERGSLIVTLSKINLIFQMAIRGNLETCQPRLVVLNECYRLIKSQKYIQAYEIIRKNKINLNFLYDVDPEGFLKNISTILSQINKTDYINLFLNSLVDNLCEELYQICPDIKEEYRKLHVTNKTNKVCDMMRAELFKINKDNKYITSILHSYTKKTPPEIFDALKLVLSLKNEEKSVKKDYTEEKTGVADQALEYICWVVNANTLYDYALKTYDFELVIMVAKHTQKDPKEYLPYLKSLQDLEPILMKYKINHDLNHFEDALVELAKGKEKHFDKCMELVVKHNLYERGMSLFTSEPELSKKFYNAYGNYLSTNNKFNEGGNAYLKSGDFNLALSCFEKSGNVNEIIFISKKLKTPPEELSNIFLEVINVCTSGNKPNEVERLQLYLSYNQELESVYSKLESKLLDSFLRLKRWNSAYNIYFTTNNPAIRTEFTEGIKFAVNLISNEYLKNTNFFEEKYIRLLKVQQEKKLNPKQFVIGELKNWDDNFSDTNSNLSNLSSGKSSKSKKTTNTKLTKKNQTKIKQRKIKEGSPIEEEYLILVLNDLKIKQEESDNIDELVKILNYSDLSELSNEVKNMLANFQKLISPAANMKTVAQCDFIHQHPEIREIFPNIFDEDFIKKKKNKLIEKQG